MRSAICVVEDEEYIAWKRPDTSWFPDCMKVLEAALETPPALFLLDVLIPGGDGFDLCRRIRGSSSLSSCHIIFLTARTGEMDRIKGLELGATTTRSINLRNTSLKPSFTTQRTIRSSRDDGFGAGTPCSGVPIPCPRG